MTDGAFETVGATDAVLLLLVIPRRHQTRDLEGADPGLIVKTRGEIDQIPKLVGWTCHVFILLRLSGTASMRRRCRPGSRRIRRDRPNAKNVINTIELEHDFSEKPGPTFSRHALEGWSGQRAEPGKSAAVMR
jgi:hypothetical protein